MSQTCELALRPDRPDGRDLRRQTASSSLDRLEQAKAAGAYLAVFPELAFTRYRPRSFLLRPGFRPRAEESLDQIASAVMASSRSSAARADCATSTRRPPSCADGEVKERIRNQLLRTTRRVSTR